MLIKIKNLQIRAAGSPLRGWIHIHIPQPWKIDTPEAPSIHPKLFRESFSPSGEEKDGGKKKENKRQLGSCSVVLLVSPLPPAVGYLMLHFLHSDFFQVGKKCHLFPSGAGSVWASCGVRDTFGMGRMGVGMGHKEL